MESSTPFYLTLSPAELELLVMAYRYLYYVECESLIYDFQYDDLECLAQSLCAKDSRVHEVGSSLAASYTQAERVKADELLKEAGR